MSLDFLFATPTDFENLLAAGHTVEEIAAMYDVKVNLITQAINLSPTKRGFRSPPAVSFGTPVSVLDLTPYMCAVVVDGDYPLPHYCGEPSVHHLRFCAEHVKTHIAKKGTTDVVQPQKARARVSRALGFPPRPTS